MRRSLSIPVFALTALVLAALLATAASAGTDAGAVGKATALPPVPAKLRACQKLALRKARAAAAGQRSAAAARRARRTQSRVKRHCSARLRRAAARQQRATSSVATSASGNLVIGIDGGYMGWSPTEIRERTELGAAVTRHEFDPTESVTDQDDVVEVAAGTIHTRIHALLGGNDLGDPTHYRDWVVAFIRHYGPGGSFWAEHPQLDASRFAISSVELGNEPYFGEMSADEYAATVRPTLEAIKALRVPVTVVLPAWIHGEDTKWIDTLYADIPNLNELYDAFAFHPYWYGQDPATFGDSSPFGRIETLRETMNGDGAAEKPIHLTEYGESTALCGSECVDEATQAEHLNDMIAAIVSHPEWGVKMLSVFQLRDRGTESGDRELQFGLLREDGSEKLSYPIVQRAMQVYRG
jgi:hypothetical protein